MADKKIEINQPTTQVSTTATGTNNGTSITVASATGIVAGMTVSGTGIAETAKVANSYSTGNTIPLTVANIGDVSGTVYFAAWTRLMPVTDWSHIENKPDPVITVNLTGDISGSGSATLTDITNGTINITTAVQPDSVALGTDTTGNYVASLSVSGTGLSLTGSSGESAIYTISSNATSASSPNTIVSRDASNNFSAGTITASLNGNSTTASALQNARNIAVSGVVSGSANFDGSSNISIATTIQPDSITLGTHTVGNYVNNLTAGTGVTISGTPGEGWSPTISIGQSVATTATPSFASITGGAIRVGAVANTLDTTSGNLIIDSAGGTTTVNDNLNVSGLLTVSNLIVNGTTTTVNSSTLTIDDPVLVLGGDTVSIDVVKDRGIEFKWAGATISPINYIGNNTTTATITVSSTSGWIAGDIVTISGATGTEQSKFNGTWTISSVTTGSFTIVLDSSVATGTYTTGLGTLIRGKNGFFGLDQGTGRFTFIPQGNNSSEVFSGSLGAIDVSDVYINGVASTGSGAIVRSTSPSFTNPALGNAFGTSLTFNGTASGSAKILATAAAGTGTVVTIPATSNANSTFVVTNDNTSQNGKILQGTATPGVAQWIALDAIQLNTTGSITGGSISSTGTLSAGTTLSVTSDGTFGGDIAINGGDITTTSNGTGSLFNTNLTTLNIGGAATAITIGSTNGTTTINNALVSQSSITGVGLRTTDFININNKAYLYTVDTTISTNTSTQIATVSASTAVEYTVRITQGSKTRVSKVLAISNGTSYDSTEFAVLELGGLISGINIAANSTGLSCTITDAATTNASVRVLYTRIP